MTYENKKVNMIINVMMTILMNRGGTDIDLHLNKNDNQFKIHIIERNCGEDKQFMTNLDTNLNIQRQHEVEEYYWKLCGDNTTDDVFMIIGVMIDKAEIFMENEDLHIKLYRNIE